MAAIDIDSEKEDIDEKSDETWDLTKINENFLKKDCRVWPDIYKSPLACLVAR